MLTRTLLLAAVLVGAPAATWGLLASSETANDPGPGSDSEESPRPAPARIELRPPAPLANPPLQEFWPTAPLGSGFYFTRAAYSSGGGLGWGRRQSWATDFPKADRQFAIVIDRTLELLDVYQGENPVRLDDPALRKFPWIYMLEVGYMNLTEPEVEGLRNYLLAGGFLVVDDFWGTYEWENFEREMGKVFPGREIVELELDHQIFNTFYDIDEVLQVPSEANARWGQRTWERDGYEAHVRGIHDDNGRLMVVINWNTDLGDAWEWSEQPSYPFVYSSFAYKLAVNYIIYSLTH